MKSALMRDRKEFRRLPYGKWTLADGSEVLFNRRYHPLWSRSPGGLAVAMRGDERIAFVSEIWFYTDANPPWLDSETRQRCTQVLTDFGVTT